MKTDDKFQRVCEIFEQARHVPTEERNAFVRDVCGSNAGLRKEVEELLTHHAHETGLLDRPITPASAHAGEPWPWNTGACWPNVPAEFWVSIRSVIHFVKNAETSWL
jgi:hypothetical protein